MPQRNVLYGNMAYTIDQAICGRGIVVVCVCIEWADLITCREINTIQARRQVVVNRWCPLIIQGLLHPIRCSTPCL